MDTLFINRLEYFYLQFFSGHDPNSGYFDRKINHFDLPSDGIRIGSSAADAMFLFSRASTNKLRHSEFKIKNILVSNFDIIFPENRPISRNTYRK